MKLPLAFALSTLAFACTSTPGPQGPAGATGAQGPVGPAGPAGATGGPYSAGEGINITGSTLAVTFGGNGSAPSAARSDHSHNAGLTPSGTNVYPAGPKLTGLWTRVQAGPVLTAAGGGAWDSSGVIYPAVVKVGGTYNMYYAGQHAGLWNGIGLATSPDGINWTRSGTTQVIALGSSGQDTVQIACASVVYDGTTFYLYYSGLDGTHWRIFAATSADGVNFTKRGLALDVGAATWENLHVHTPSVIKDGSTWRMYYMGGTGSPVVWGGIGLATSTDGLAWSRFASNPVLTSSQGWDNSDIGMPTVVKIGAGYYLQHTGSDGNNWRAGLATSLDGVTWSEAPFNPTMGLVTGTFQTTHIHQGSLLVDGDRIWYWYSGYDGTTWSIGAAVQLLQ